MQEACAFAVDFCRASLEGPFVSALSRGDVAYCVMIRNGSVRFQTDFPTSHEAELSHGDVIAFSGLVPHTFRPPAADGAAVVRDLSLRSLGKTGAPPTFEALVALAPSKFLAQVSLMIGPVIVRQDEHPALARRFSGAVQMLEDEHTDPPRVRRDLRMHRIAQILLLSICRAGLTDRHGVPDRLSDRTVMRTIHAVLGQPDRPWRLGELARTSGMSRTRFAEAFRLATGWTPARFATRMRLNAVAWRLASEQLRVEAAAKAAGYGSSAAFARTFHRAFGETPARWRRRQRDLEAVRASRWPVG